MSTMIKSKNEFLNFLISEKALSSEQAATAEEHALSEGVSVEQLLVQEKLLPENELSKKKAKFFGLPFIDLQGQKLDPAVLKIIPKAVAEHYRMIAFGREASEIKVAILDPRNYQAMAAMDVLASGTNLKIRYYLADRAGLEGALKLYEELTKEVADVLASARQEVAPEVEKELGSSVEEVIKGAPVSRIVSVIMRHAYEGKASDIHIEPHRGESRVRYRIDGVLKVSLAIPEELHAAIVARIKVLANLKLDETRIPQDGRITEMIAGKPVDFRVSILPLQEGKEKVVMRILATERAPTLAELGFHEEHIKIIAANVIKPHGLLLISGPTGAGKSTTLYAVLTMLNLEGSNIVTLEDPIEYFVGGVNQSQIRPEVGYTFSSGLRAILRQDPNVIMVGEIRDSETAELAIHAALTGHLLLTTIHTNDAIGVIPRLIDLKAEPFLLAATFNLAIAQRLARKICADCKEPVTLPETVVLKMAAELKGVPTRFLTAGLDINKPLTFYRGKGCAKCGTTGYKGRVAVGEVLQGTPELCHAIAIGFPQDEVQKAVKLQDMITMKQDALLKALQGLTTVEEVLRISQE